MKRNPLEVQLARAVMDSIDRSTPGGMQQPLSARSAAIIIGTFLLGCIVLAACVS